MSNEIPPLDELSKEELISEVIRLRAHVTQLKNILEKKSETTNSCHQKNRKFDFSRYNTRHVALKILYVGWDYDGLVVQEDTQRTIECALFSAFQRTKLIESRESSNYHRCGRTDKGVSAFSQVISIDFRTHLSEGVGVKLKEGASRNGSDDSQELNYVYILNKVLPAEIRVLAWCPVSEDFSARFSCIQRTYKYIFPKANLNLQKMEEASKFLIGEKDFRNLCKMDVANGVTNFVRKIISVKLQPLSAELGQNEEEEENGYKMYVLTIVGQAFLWHQIRCIVAILMMIGQDLEDVQVVEKLLDVENCPQKPQYSMASEIPLVLYSCEYDGLEWRTDNDSQREILTSMQTLWSTYSIKSSMIRLMLSDLEKSAAVVASDQLRIILPSNYTKSYKALFDRPKCESLESRMSHYNGKRKRKCFMSPADNKME